MLAYGLLIDDSKRSSTGIILANVTSREEMRSKVAGNKKDTEELVFRCTACNFVLKQEKGEPSPSYCPNCAIQHLGGEMVPVSESATDKQREKAPSGNAGKVFSKNKTRRFS